MDFPLISDRIAVNAAKALDNPVPNKSKDAYDKENKRLWYPVVIFEEKLGSHQGVFRIRGPERDCCENLSDDLTTTEYPKSDTRYQNEKVQYINFAEDDQMEIQGFVVCKLKSNICLALYMATLGILRLLFHWYPVLLLKATHRRCDLKKAEKVLIIDDYNGKKKTYFVKQVITLNSEDLNGNIDKNLGKSLKFCLADGRTKELYQTRIIKCKKLTYAWDEEIERFIKIAGLENGITRAQLLHQYAGQPKEEQARQRIVYGKNEINTPEQTVLTLLVLEALTPFYFFQLFSLFVWIPQNYLYYGAAIVIMSVVGIAISIIQTRKNQKNLKGTVSFASMVTISRGDGTYEEISTKDLVPGDVIIVPKHGCEMHCDAVLLTGNCIVNESMLTGESVPVTKTPIDNNDAVYNVKEDVNHILFCGTKVIQTRTPGEQKVTAVVIRTGFLTTKGELVRSILYPPPADFKFDQDSYKFIGILAVIALVGAVYTFISKISRQASALVIIVKTLNLFTIVIPPALPAAMTIGKLYALQRLKNYKIFCINSRVINVSGSVDCVCFDKTGTLTEDALDMWGVVPIENNKIEQPIKDIETLPYSSDLLRCMTACHTLTAIDGEVAGDPLDIKMFESTKWTFEDNHCSENKQDECTPLFFVRSPGDGNSTITNRVEIGITKQFQFSSALQRMSVITSSSGVPNFEIFCKGSPEKIISLSDKSSIPEDINRKLMEYTEQGYRVIGLATKKLPEHMSYQSVIKLGRNEVENGLTFLGLLILENRLKPQTVGVIKTLKDAELKVVMITGDNIQTAVTVARDCEIIDKDCKVIEVLTEKPNKYESASISYHVLSQSTNKATTNGTKDIESTGESNRNYCFVITGQSWANVVKHFPDLIPKIVTKGVVFARMSGSQKQQLVEQLKILGYYIAMCGDGANDCGALKAAHVGISLSEAESSVASPFTSKEPNISCTPKVIKEGRAALVTSFGVFKMMLCYSLTEFASVILLFGINTSLSSLQFLFIDLCLILNLAASFGRTKAYEKLAKTPPRTSLLSFVPLCSITLFMTVTVFFQIFAYHFIQTFDWFTPFNHNNSTSESVTSFYMSYENYAVFCVSMFQYIIMAIIFSKGKPYRKNIFTNYISVFCILLMVAICSYISLAPQSNVDSILELKMPPYLDGRYFVIWTAILNFWACYIVETLFVEVVLGKFIEPKLRCFTKSKKKYLDVIKGLKNDALWPKIHLDMRKVDCSTENEKNGVENGGYVGSQVNLQYIRG